MMLQTIVQNLLQRVGAKLAAEFSFAPARPTIFLHVPKSAGMAFHTSLSESIEATSIVSGFDHSLFGAFAAFDTIGPDVSATIYAPGTPLPADADFVGGHFARSTLQRFYRRANWCALVREPVCRLISHWLYWRQHSEADLAPWGADWSQYVLLARQPLVAFLQAPEVACQTDNVVTRMLLWPDRRIPAGGFIAAREDAALGTAALSALRSFHFLDYLENPLLVANLAHWIGRPVALKHVNETRRAHEGFPADLDRELTPEAFALLEARSRLDLVLWRRLAERRSPGEDHEALRARVLKSAIDRHKAIQD